MDIDRQKRRGFAEVIYCPGKAREHIVRIASQLIKNKQDLLLTRLDKKTFVYLKKKIPGLKYNSLAKAGFLIRRRSPVKKGLALVISAGTADMPIAEEAVVTLETMGNCVKKLYDVGVAGVHRLIHHEALLKSAKVIIVVAGMEGALASLVAGLVSVPVIAVPTSCGYGANFKGLAALLTMLNSCSPGIATVNIDNGFGAGYFAGLVNK
ncbi:MAG: nickel pincer cofactor biosynthesis protein LarB [Candidatus Omnitrophota bacterium]